MAATYTEISYIYHQAYKEKKLESFIRLLDDPYNYIFKSYRLANGSYAPLSPAQQIAFLTERENIKLLKEKIKELKLDANIGDNAFNVWVHGAAAVTAACRPKYTANDQPMFKVGTETRRVCGIMSKPRDYIVVVPAHITAEVILLWDKKNFDERKAVTKRVEQIANDSNLSFDDRYDAELVINESVLG